MVLIKSLEDGQTASINRRTSKQGHFWFVGRYG
jgi:hypothetical protein